MLGLRKNPLKPLGKRNKRHSLESDTSRRSSVDTIASSDTRAPDAANSDAQMDFLRRHESVPAVTAKPVVNVSVTDLQLSDSEESNSAKNQLTEALTVTNTKPSVISTTQISRVIETGRAIKRRIVYDLDDVDEAFFDRVTLDQFLDFIADERLIHMPRKGSQWDRVLKSAEYFALQLYSFAQAVGPFVSESKNASYLAIGFSQLLLELGCHQAQALEPTFDVLYELSALVAQALQRREFFHSNEQIKEDLGDIYTGLVSLVGEVALYYRQRIGRMSTETVSIDFNGAFGKSIDRIWSKREHLSNHLWGFNLRHKHFSISIEDLRHKLSPFDLSAKALMFGRLADKAERAVGTCEWVQHHMLDFFRGSDHVLTITGASGCGKSMLAGWIKDRLQRPLGRKSYETISFTFANDAPAEARPLAFLKNVLHQLLERNVGDARLYEMLVKAFETSSEHNSSSKLEHALWEALEAGLKTVEEEKSHMVLIVDGLDEVKGHENASHLHKRLHTCVQKFSMTKAITLSRPVSHLGGAGTKHLVITPEHTQDDIATFFWQSLSQFQHFNSQSSGTQASFVDDLVKKAKGSFLWAFFLVKLLGFENSYENFYKAGQTAPHDLHSMLHKHAERVDMKNTHTRFMLAFMLVSERPLTLSEMEDLLALNVQKKSITSPVNLKKHIAANCSNLVVVRKGLIRFKHSEIRKLFKEELCGKALPSIKEAHAELVKRMLCYAGICLTGSQEPTLDGLSGEVVRSNFKTHCVLEYVARTWIHHFRHSSYCGEKDELHLSQELKDVFPESTLLAMIEWTCWQDQTAMGEVLRHHDLSLRIRTACLGEKHRAVMQNVIVLAMFYRSRSELIKASEFFYRATIIGQTVLSNFSAVVISCTTLFLSLTETITITKRTEIVTYREEMIRLMIVICKRKNGESSDIVIKWYETLAKLYIDINEEFRASVVYKELYQILVLRFGRSHHRTKGISGKLGGLAVVLHGEDNEMEIEESETFLFETGDEVEETSDLRITVILRLAKAYETKKQWVLAEKLYLNLWRRICEICRTEVSIEMQIMKINVALEYVRFLQRIKRIEEATSILICLWAEFEHQSFESETIIIRIKEIGTLFRAFGLLTVAISVFGKVWSWFKAKGKTESEDAISTTILITEVVEEITETTTVTKTTTTTTTTTVVEETIVREIFETTYERYKRSKADKHFFKACMALIKLYVKESKWSECEVVTTRALELTWSAVLTVDAKLILSGAYISECIAVATQLAICYHRQRSFTKAEEIYLRIYRACLFSFKVEDTRVAEAAMNLIHFYEEYHRHEKVIEIYAELLAAYRKHLGATHRLVIKTLYALGSICMTLGRSDAYDYYIQIVTVLNKGTHCHHDAFEAAIIVCRYYYEEKRWAELQKTCAILWETFVHHHHEFSFTEEMIISLYERYLYVLEFHAKVEFSVLYKLSIQYRETVTKYFSASAAILITAMIALAQICEKHEDHYHESVTLYEEVIKKMTTTTTTTMTTTVTETITKTVKMRLSKMYVTIITTGKTSSTTTIERGITIALEIFEHLKIEFGCWHEQTLIQLKDLVLLYKKIGTKESHGVIIRILQTNVIEIISKVTTSITLYEAAVTMASIYVSAGMIRYGQELLHHLRHLILLHDIGSTDHITIKLDVKISKIMFVFLAAFELRLAEKIVLTYTEIMADILLETFLYEQYKHAIKTETKIEVLLEYGAKLRCFWHARGHKSHIEILDKKLFEVFRTKFALAAKTHEDFIFIFYVALVQDLGKDRAAVDLAHIVCLVSNSKVKALLEAGEFQQAHEVARCAFQIISAHGYYKLMRNVGCGYKLAEYMAGIDIRKPADNKVRESMLETSRTIVAEVLASCRAAKISFVSLKFEDVAGLVRLLGDQQYYSELEALLEALWQSREVQRTWSPATVLSIGKLLIHAHYAASHVTKAVELCDTVCYNLRRSRGWLDRDAVEASRLLASLLSATGRHRAALAVDEEVLRELDEDGDSRRADVAGQQLELLRRRFARAGAWHTSEKAVHELVGRLRRFGGGASNVASVEQWNTKTSDGLGVYAVPREWRLETEMEKQAKKKSELTKWAARRSLGKNNEELKMMQWVY